MIPAVLVAHNGRKFDFPILMRSVQCSGQMDTFCDHIISFVDSLPLLQNQLPDRNSYKLEDIVMDILTAELFEAHDATEDVAALQKVFQALHISLQTVRKFSISPTDVVKNRNFLNEKHRNFPSLQPLIARGVCSNHIAESIAGSGLQLSHLKKIYQRKGEDGLVSIFCADVEGKPRVTNSKKVLNTVIPKLAGYFDQE